MKEQAMRDLTDEFYDALHDPSWGESRREIVDDLVAGGWAEEDAQRFAEWFTGA